MSKSSQSSAARIKPSPVQRVGPNDPGQPSRDGLGMAFQPDLARALDSIMLAAEWVRHLRLVGLGDGAPPNPAARLSLHPKQTHRRKTSC